MFAPRYLQLQEVSLKNILAIALCTMLAQCAPAAAEEIHTDCPVSFVDFKKLGPYELPIDCSEYVRMPVKQCEAKQNWGVAIKDKTPMLTLKGTFCGPVREN